MTEECKDNKAVNKMECNGSLCICTYVVLLYFRAWYSTRKPKKTKTNKQTKKRNLTHRLSSSLWWRALHYGEGDSTKICHLVSESELLLFAEERQAAVHTISGKCRNSSSVIAAPRQRILVGHQHCENMRSITTQDWESWRGTWALQ